MLNLLSVFRVKDLRRAWQNLCKGIGTIPYLVINLFTRPRHSVKIVNQLYLAAIKFGGFANF